MWGWKWAPIPPASVKPSCANYSAQLAHNRLQMALLCCNKKILVPTSTDALTNVR